MPHFGPTELIIILVIILAIFGAGRLGSVGGSLARGIRDFRKELSEDKPKDEEADAKG
jgi:sec-independent protein translocase protein TatA